MFIAFKVNVVDIAKKINFKNVFKKQQNIMNKYLLHSSRPENLKEVQTKKFVKWNESISRKK